MFAHRINSLVSFELVVVVNSLHHTISTYTHLHTHTRTRTHTCTLAHTYTHVYTHTCTLAHTYTHAYTQLSSWMLLSVQWLQSKVATSLKPQPQSHRKQRPKPPGTPAKRLSPRRAPMHSLPSANLQVPGSVIKPLQA